VSWEIFGRAGECASYHRAKSILGIELANHLIHAVSHIPRSCTISTWKLCSRWRTQLPADIFLDHDVEWDGTPRFDHWLGNYCNAEVTELNGEFGSKLLVAGVRRIKGGCVHRFVTEPLAPPA
jgi:hypothetical protein